MIRLSVSERGATARLVTFNQHQVTIGRTSDCDLCLGGTGISGRHCRISMTGQGLVLEDLGSTNGTYLNRARISGPSPITSADEIIVAMYQVKVMTDGAMVSAAPMGRAGGHPPGPQPSSPRPATGVMPMGSTGGHAPVPQVASPRPATGVMPAAFPGPAAAPRSTSSPPPGPHSSPTAARTAGHGASGAHQVVSSPDAQWAREWEKLDGLARAWFSSGKDRKALLKGAKLTHARAWLASGRGKSPPPKTEHRDFIFASSRARQLRVVRNVTLGGLVLSIGAVGAVKIVQLTDDEGEGDTAPEVAVVDDADEPKAGGEGGNSSGPRRGELSERAARAATSVAESDPALATLLATEGLAQLGAGVRGSSAERAFRGVVGALRGQPLHGHGGKITDAAFTSDGRWAITASSDHSVRLWDRQGDGPQSMIPLRGHSRGVLDLEVSPDAKFLFTAGENGKIFRWSLTDAEPMSSSVLLAGHSTAVGSLALSTDGRWLVSGSSDGAVRVWNASSPVPKSRVFSGHTGPIRAVAVDATGTRVLAASQDGTASIWKSNDGAPGRRTVLQAGTEEEPAEILDIEISPDGTWVLTGHSNGVARLWDPNRRIPSLTARTLSGHEGPVPHVAFTPDSTLAVTAGDDQKLRIWDLGAKDPSLNAPTFHLHKGKITALGTSGAVQASGPRRRVAVTASEDGSVRTWNLERRSLEQDSTAFQTEGPATAVAVSADGQYVLGGSQAGGVTIWPAQSSEASGASMVAWGHTKPVTSVAVNPVGTRMVSTSADGTGKVWDVTRPGRVALITTLAKHEGQVVAVAVSADGKYVATGDNGGGIRVWDLNKPDPGAAALALDKHKRGIQQLGFTADGKRLVSLSSDAVYLWSLTRDPASTAVRLSQKDELVAFSISRDSKRLFTGGVKQLRLWELDAADVAASGKSLKRAHGLDIITVGIGARGRWAASSGKDATLVLWNLAKGAKPIELYLHEKPVDAIAFSPDGHWLATGSQDTAVRLWDLTSDRPQKGAMLLEGHSQRIGKLRFSEDSRWLLSASNDKTIRVYDMQAGDGSAVAGSAVVLEGHGGVVSGIDVSADGRTIVSGSYDLTARAWPMTSDKLAPIGCLRTGRSLSRDEWERYFEDAPYHRTCG